MAFPVRFQRLFDILLATVSFIRLATHVLTTFAAGRMPRIVGMGAFTAIVLGVFDFTGGKLTGWAKETDEDRFERKEYLRKNRRRSGEETIAQLGDGRAGSKFDTDQPSHIPMIGSILTQQ